MKDVKKILLMDIPSPLGQALAEQFSFLEGIEIISVPDISVPPDVVVAGKAVDGNMFPGCPVLFLREEKSWRLGDVLRQVGQMLSQPVLYIDDIFLGTCTFKAQEKSIERETGEEVSLTDREVDILAYLARRKGKPVSRDELLKNIWRYQEGVDTHTLETHIYRLRQKMEELADAPRILLTAEGGYSLQIPEAKA